MPGRRPARLATEIKKYEKSLGRVSAAFRGIRWRGAHADLSRRPKKDIQIHLISDTRMARLNADYRSKQGATDVLSFAYGESGAPVFAHEPVGEVCIALQTAARQAREHAHSLADELRILTIHGALHVMGYDHEGKTDATHMRTAEARVLKTAGSPAAQGLIGR